MVRRCVTPILASPGLGPGDKAQAKSNDGRVKIEEDEAGTTLANIDHWSQAKRGVVLARLCSRYPDYRRSDRARLMARPTWSMPSTSQRAKKGDSDKTVPAEEQGRGRVPSPAIKKEQRSSTALATVARYDGAAGPRTTAWTQAQAPTAEKPAAEPLWRQVQRLEKLVEHQRSRAEALFDDNDRLAAEVAELNMQRARAVSRAARHDARHEAIISSLQSERDQAADKLEATKAALRTERERRERAVEMERRARTLLEERAGRESFELRKFRTALAAAFKLLPSLADQVSFHALLERTGRHLRNKTAGRGLRLESASGDKASKASSPGTLDMPRYVNAKQGLKRCLQGTQTVLGADGSGSGSPLAKYRRAFK